MKLNKALLRDLAHCTTGANIHHAKNLEYAYRGFCKRAILGKTPEDRRNAADRAKAIEREIRHLILEATQLN